MTRAALKDSRGLRAFMVERAIFEREDLTAHEKLVLWYLAMRANSESECWPSYKTIAKDCSISRRSAINVVAGLEEKGLLAKSSRANDLGRFTSNLFRLFSAEEQVLPPWQNPAPGDGADDAPPKSIADSGAPDALPGAEGALGMVQDVHLYEQDQEEQFQLNAGGGVETATLETPSPAIVAHADQVLAQAIASGKRIGNPQAYRAAVIRSVQEQASSNRSATVEAITESFSQAIARSRGEEYVCATCEGLGLVDTDRANVMTACPACRQ